jgi:hypothetical protein
MNNHDAIGPSADNLVQAETAARKPETTFQESGLEPLPRPENKPGGPLASALEYARRRWPVMPIHGITTADGAPRCTCTSSMSIRSTAVTRVLANLSRLMAPCRRQ